MVSPGRADRGRQGAKLRSAQAECRCRCRSWHEWSPLSQRCWRATLLCALLQEWLLLPLRVGWLWRELYWDLVPLVLSVGVGDIVLVLNLLVAPDGHGGLLRRRAPPAAAAAAAPTGGGSRLRHRCAPQLGQIVDVALDLSGVLLLQLSALPSHAALADWLYCLALAPRLRRSARLLTLMRGGRHPRPDDHACGVPWRLAFVVASAALWAAALWFLSSNPSIIQPRGVESSAADDGDVAAFRRDPWLVQLSQHGVTMDGRIAAAWHAQAAEAGSASQDEQYRLSQEDVGRLLLASVFWGVSSLSTVGYAGLAPSSPAEAVLGSALIWLKLVLSALVAAVICHHYVAISTRAPPHRGARHRRQSRGGGQRSAAAAAGGAGVPTAPLLHKRSGGAVLNPYALPDGQQSPPTAAHGQVSSQPAAVPPHRGAHRGGLAMHSSRDGEEQHEPAAAALRLAIEAELGGGGGGADPAATHGAAYANAVGVLAAHCREQLPRKLGQQVIRRLSAARMARIRQAERQLQRLPPGLRQALAHERWGETLQRSCVFAAASCEVQFVAQCAALMEEAVLEPGEYLHRRGETALHLCFVLGGGHGGGRGGGGGGGVQVLSSSSSVRSPSRPSRGSGITRDDHHPVVDAESSTGTATERLAHFGMHHHHHHPDEAGGGGATPRVLREVRAYEADNRHSTWERVQALGTYQGVVGEVPFLMCVPHVHSARADRQHGARLLRLSRAAWRQLCRSAPEQEAQVVAGVLAAMGVDKWGRDVGGAAAERVHLLLEEEYQAVRGALVCALDERRLRAMRQIHRAAAAGDAAGVAQLLAEGVHADEQSFDGRTPLHLAACHGHTELVELLVSAGADVSARDAYGRSAIEAALARKHVATVRVLRALGATDTPPAAASTAPELQRAGGRQSDDLGLGKSPPLARATDRMSPALQCALLDDDVTQVCELLGAAKAAGSRHGSGIQLSDHDDKTCLHYAAAGGSVRLCSTLLSQFGAAVNARDRWGNTPLQLAAQRLNETVALMLAGHGGVIDARRATACMVEAARAGEMSQLQMLLNVCGVDVDEHDYCGQTPTHIAASQGHVQCVNFLISSGADLSVQSAHGRTALDDAVCAGNWFVAKLLHAAGGRSSDASTDEAMHAISATQVRDFVKLSLTRQQERSQQGSGARDNSTAAGLQAAIDDLQATLDATIAQLEAAVALVEVLEVRQPPLPSSSNAAHPTPPAAATATHPGHHQQQEASWPSSQQPPLVLSPESLGPVHKLLARAPPPPLTRFQALHCGAAPLYAGLATVQRAVASAIPQDDARHVVHTASVVRNVALLREVLEDVGCWDTPNGAAASPSRQSVKELLGNVAREVTAELQVRGVEQRMSVGGYVESRGAGAAAVTATSAVVVGEYARALLLSKTLHATLTKPLTAKQKALQMGRRHQTSAGLRRSMITDCYTFIQESFDCLDVNRDSVIDRSDVAQTLQVDPAEELPSICGQSLVCPELDAIVQLFKAAPDTRLSRHGLARLLLPVEPIADVSDAVPGTSGFNVGLVGELLADVVGAAVAKAEQRRYELTQHLAALGMRGTKAVVARLERAFLQRRAARQSAAEAARLAQLRARSRHGWAAVRRFVRRMPGSRMIAEVQRQWPQQAAGRSALAPLGIARDVTPSAPLDWHACLRGLPVKGEHSLRQLFVYTDADDDGVLSRAEVRKLLESLDARGVAAVSEETLDAVFDFFDVSLTAPIHWSAFAAGWAKLNRSTRQAVSAIPWHMLLPHSAALRRWRRLTLCGASYYLVTVPVRIAFFTRTSTAVWHSFAFDYVVDTLFALDVIVESRVCYVSKRGELISDPRKTFHQYLRHGGFFPDAAAVAPLDVFARMAGASLLFVNWSRVLKLLRLLRLARLIQSTRRRDRRPLLSALGRLSIAFMALAHFAACVWFLLVRGWGTDGQRWRATETIDTWDASDQDSDTRAVTQGIDEYLLCLYWTTSTLSGTGAAPLLQPTNAAEGLGTLVLLMLQMSVVLYLVLEFGAAVFDVLQSGRVQNHWPRARATWATQKMADSSAAALTAFGMDLQAVKEFQVDQATNRRGSFSSVLGKDSGDDESAHKTPKESGGRRLAAYLELDGEPLSAPLRQAIEEHGVAAVLCTFTVVVCVVRWTNDICLSHCSVSLLLIVKCFLKMLRQWHYEICAARFQFHCWMHAMGSNSLDCGTSFHQR